MTSTRWLVLTLPLALTLVACKKDASAEKEKSRSEESDDDAPKKKKAKKGDDGDKTDKPAGSGSPSVKSNDGPKPETPKVEASSTPDKAVTAPAMQSYKLDGIKKIDDACSSPWVIVANAPESVGADYEWKWSKQALIANQQFHVVSGTPSAPGEVAFEVHQADSAMSDAWVLVARCNDGATCNYLAAMYKAVVKSSHPQPVCGSLPANLGAAKKHVDFLAGGPEANLPHEGDTISLCARLSACNVAVKPDLADDVGLQCQKAPGSFKTTCATRYPCAQVMECLGN